MKCYKVVLKLNSSIQVFFIFYLGKYKGHVLAASMQYSELPGADESDNINLDSSYGSQSTKLWTSTTVSERDSLVV